MDGVFVHGEGFEVVFKRKLPKRFIDRHIRITLEVVD